MAGYVRQSTADIIPTATVRAAPINAEYNALRDAFAASGGHKHDGTSGEGEYVPLIADLDALNKVVIDTTNNRVGVFVEVSAAAVEQIRIQDGVIVPVTDNDIDLGTSSVEFKDLYLDGTAYIDTLAVHESATITSNFSVNGNTTLGNAASDTVTFTADIASAMLPSADNTHDLGAVGSEWRNLYIDGTANIDALIADTATISAGTIDNTVIGGSTAVAGSFSTISSSGATTLASLTVSGATALNGGLTLDTNKFTVADTTGNTAIAGTLDVTGATTVADFTATGTTVLPATSFGDNNITNVGNIALDSITADGSSITITGNTTFADGAYDFDVASHDGSNGLKLAGTLVTSSAAELNKLDGATVTTTEINILDGDNSATSTTVADADRVVMNDNGTMVQVAVTDLAAYFDDEITAMPNLVTTAATTVGALNSGSITSGFGSIDTGSSTITTTGNITGGNVIISDGGNIGSASDTDAIAIASNGNVTLSQNLTVSGDLQVDGTTTTVNSNNLSVDDQLIELGNGRTGSATGDSGIVIERGSDANAFIGFDESADKFTVGTGTFTGTSTGDLSITTGTLVANIEGNVTGDLTGNADTATALETARTIAGQSFDGTANISIATTDLTSVTATAAEVNIMDGDTAASSTTLADADRVVVNDDGTMKQVALTDFETYFESALDTLSNVTTVGTLNSGSITSGFGSIDNGSSAITTTGTITFGTLSDGSDSVTDIVTSVGSGSANSELPTALAVENRIQAINSISNNVSGLNATGAELNSVADVSAITIDTSTAIANNDGIAVFDSSASAIGYFDVDLLDTYFAGTTKTLTNKTLTSPTVSGLYLSDAGFIVEGSSADGNESTVTFTNPTADRTITFPDATGTVALSGATQNVDFGTVTADGLTVADSSPTIVVQDSDGTNQIGTLRQGGQSTILSSRNDAADGIIKFMGNGAGSETERMRISSNGDITFYDTDGTTASFVYDASAGTTFNEAGADRDFRVESDSNTHALFVDAGAEGGQGAVGIGTSSVNRKFVVSEQGANGIEIDPNISGHSEIISYNRSTSAYTRLDIAADDLRLYGASGGITLNDSSQDSDFRVESDGNANMLFVDAGANHVNIGTSTDLGGMLNVAGQIKQQSGSSVALQLESTQADNNTGPYIYLYGNSSSPAANDITGGIVWRYNDDGGSEQSGMQINHILYDVAAASDDTGFAWYNKVGGTDRQIFTKTNSEIIVNQDGVDLDFRIETAAQGYAFFIDAASDTVTFSNQVVTMTHSGNGKQLELVSTDADGNSGPQLDLYRNSASPANDDYTGRIKFISRNNNSQDFTAVDFLTRTIDVSDGSEDATLFINTMTGGTTYNRLNITPTEIVINEESRDLDFRVESNNSSATLFVDGQYDGVGIHTTSPISYANAQAVLFIEDNVNPAIGISDTGQTRDYWIYANGNKLGIDYGDGSNTGGVSNETQMLHLHNDSDGAVFNEGGADRDFRVESDSDTHMMFMDASTSRLGIIRSAPAYTLDVNGQGRFSTSDNDSTLILQCTDSDASLGPIFDLLRNVRGSDADVLGVMRFQGNDDADNITTYAQVVSKIIDASNSTEDGQLNIETLINNDMKFRQTFTNAEVNFNEGGIDSDFRVESDSNVNMLFVDAGNNQVNIGTSTNYGSALNVFTTGTDALEIVSDNGNANAGPYLDITRKSSSPADGDSTGAIRFLANSDAAETTVASINTVFDDVSNASEDSSLFFKIRQAGAQPNVLDLSPSETVVNNDSYDRDFRVESDGTSSAFIVDGADNNAYFFTNTLPIMGSTGIAGVSIGNNGSPEMRILRTDSSPNMWLKKQGATGTAISFYKDSAAVGTIVINSSSVSYNTTSDYRLKENVVDLTGATTRLKQLEPKRFNFISDTDDTTVDGFIAHEVQSVVPEAITGTHNEVDADGNPVYQGIDQSKLVPLLVATIKELEARITALENA